MAQKNGKRGSCYAPLPSEYREEIDDLVEKGACHYHAVREASASSPITLVRWSESTLEEDDDKVTEKTKDRAGACSVDSESELEDEYWEREPLINDKPMLDPPLLPMFYKSPDPAPKPKIKQSYPDRYPLSTATYLNSDYSQPSGSEYTPSTPNCSYSPLNERNASPRNLCGNSGDSTPIAESDAIYAVNERASQLNYRPLRCAYYVNNFSLNKRYRDAVLQKYSERAAHLAGTVVGFWLCFALVPTLLVLMWCSVPIPRESPKTFYFFLLWYYGLFNLVSIVFLSRIFKLYAIKWWPTTQRLFNREILWNSVAWFGSLITGFFVRRVTWPVPIFGCALTWFGVTLLMQLLPIGLAMLQTFWRRSSFRRRSLTLIQRTFVSEDVILESYRISKKGRYRERSPKSLKRFTAFCSVLLLTVVGLALANGLASVYVARYPHSTVFAGVAYNFLTYSLVYLLDLVADFILHTRVKSRPLQYLFRLYFYMIYYMFYRLLFTRLQTPLQFIAMQTVQAVWINVSVPITMSTSWYNFCFQFAGYSRPYEDHVRSVGRSYFLRNVAETASLFTFLFCLPVLHLGPNSPFYPLYQYDDSVYPLKFSLTMIYALVALTVEQATAFMTRRHIFIYHKVNVLQNAKREFQRCKSLLFTFIVIIVMVQMDTVISLFNLNLL